MAPTAVSTCQKYFLSALKVSSGGFDSVCFQPRLLLLIFLLARNLSIAMIAGSALVVFVSVTTPVGFASCLVFFS